MKMQRECVVCLSGVSSIIKYKGFQGIIVVFVLCFRSRIEKVNYRQKEKAVLDEILGHGYDKRIRPSGKNDTGTSNDFLMLGHFLTRHSCPLPKYLYTFENFVEILTFIDVIY